MSTYRPARALRIAVILLCGALAGTIANPAAAAETVSAIARDARLYDKFFAENRSAKPETNHPAYANKAGKYGKDASWRCKECHGWDYRGKDGAYAGGSHATGIVGITAAAGKDPAAIVAVLRNATHSYTARQLSDHDANDLALFVSKGQVDPTKYIDTTTKRAKGDAAKGEVYFNTVCAGCHGVDGKKVKDAPALGSVADNAAEMLHKVLNGQPGENMPALRALDPQISVDIVSYLPQLPKE